MTSCSHPLVQADAVAITTAIKQRGLRSDLIWGLGVIPHMQDAFSFCYFQVDGKGLMCF